MNISIVIIEDYEQEAQHLITELSTWSEKKQVNTSISTYTSGEEYFSKTCVHTAAIYFLDIQLSGMNGVNIAKRLRNEGFHGEIIFLTSFKEYILDGYQVHALNYLLKPIKQATLFPCMDEVLTKFIGNNYIFRGKNEIIQIPYHKIMACSSSLHYVDILTESGTFTQHTTLSHVLSHLPKEFIQTHRSYIVNMTHIYKIIGNTIILSNGLKVQIGRKYLNDVRTAFLEYSARFDT